MDDYYGGVDEVSFQMYGYGGFGYDTSDVRPSQKASPVVVAATEGDLSKIQSILEAEKDADKRRRLLNEARRWTEVDYKMSGFTNEYEWFDLTPIATAAYYGNPHVVDYLLRQGADPTLEGCPTDDEYYDALGAANSKLKEYRGGIRSKADFRLCVNLLEAAKTFWTKPSYADSSYSNTKRSGYPNQPTDMAALIAALDAVKEQESVVASKRYEKKSKDAGRKPAHQKKSKDAGRKPAHRRHKKKRNQRMRVESLHTVDTKACHGPVTY